MSRQHNASFWARRPVGVAGAAARGAPARSAAAGVNGLNGAAARATGRLESQVSIKVVFKSVFYSSNDFSAHLCNLKLFLSFNFLYSVHAHPPGTSPAASTGSAGP